MRHKCIYKNSLISEQKINITHSFQNLFIYNIIAQTFSLKALQVLYEVYECDCIFYIHNDVVYGNISCITSFLECYEWCLITCIKLWFED